DGRAAMLRGKRDDRRRSAKCRGDAAAVEVVGGHDPHPGELLDMAMAVDAPGKHITAACVDIAGARRKTIRESDDLLPGNADVATRRFGRSRDGAIADGELELVHLLLWSRVDVVHPMHFFGLLDD